MVELEFDDMVTDHSGKEVINEEVPNESEPKEAKSCCCCGDIIGENEEVFDSDNCVHCVCVCCRFQDGLKCLQCTPVNKTTINTAEVKFKDAKDSFYEKISMFLPRKKFNTDHIVDVELSSGEGTGSVHKQMCTVCQRVFKKTNARYHYACATGDKPFSCSECDQKFVKKSHMETHLNSHYGIKPFKCSVVKCKASFTQKDKLIRHMKTHNKDVKHSCPVCCKSYSSQPILNLHMNKVHSSAKPFQCDLCPRSYKYKRSLRVHRLKHLAIREYMCEVCGKKYTLFSQLKHHKRSHVLYHRRPHKCSCGRRFMTRRDRARHELIHTSSRNDFECSLCNTTFGRKDNLERHMKNFHQEDPPTLSKSVNLTAAVAPFENYVENTIVSKKSDKLEYSIKSKELQKSSTEKKKDADKNNKTKDSKRPKKNKKKDNQDIETSQTDNLITNKNQEVKPNYNQTPSVIVSPKPSENQSRPSVIKNIPKLLPYRVLPPDKRFLKMTEEYTRGKSISDLIPPTTEVIHTKSDVNTLKSPVAIEINKSSSSLLNTLPNLKHLIDKSSRKTICEEKPSTLRTPKRRILKDDALNRCFRIICHTSSVQIEQVPEQQMPPDNIRLEEDFRTVISRPSDTAARPWKDKSIKSKEEIGSGQVNRFIREIDRSSDISDHSMVHAPLEVPDSNPTNFPGGPSLPASFPENTAVINNEDNFTNSLTESCYATYTPYFDNECFRDSYYEGCVEHLLPNDLDIGFQYINEQLGCAETGFASDSKIVRYVSQETRLVKESFS